MVFKLTIATIILAAFAGASIVNRVACPGGTTFASDEAVSALYLDIKYQAHLAYTTISAALSFLCGMTFRISSLENVERMYMRQFVLRSTTLSDSQRAES